jgi:hypothetical protein
LRIKEALWRQGPQGHLTEIEGNPFRDDPILRFQIIKVTFATLLMKILQSCISNDPYSFGWQ